MTQAKHYNSKTPGRAARPRHGMGTLDLLVSFTLLMTVMTAVTPLVVRYQRTIKSHRDYRLALDELSNQMDRLTMLPEADLPGALQQLTPSAFVKERLVSPKLTAELQRVETGSRVILRMSWGDIERDRAPATLAGWVFTPTTQTAAAAASADSP